LLDHALAVAAELRAAVAAEVDHARRVREALRTLDSERVLESAARRAAFNAHVARLERSLTHAVRAAGGALGILEPTLSALARRAPAASALSEALAEITALAGTLCELDRLNGMLAGRALVCVHAYLAALHPSPAAYDRRGLRSRPPLAAISTKA